MNFLKIENISSVFVAKTLHHSFVFCLLIETVIKTNKKELLKKEKRKRYFLQWICPSARRMSFLKYKSDLVTFCLKMSACLLSDPSIQFKHLNLVRKML